LVSDAVAEAAHATEVLAAEATPCRLQAHVVRVGGRLVVLVLPLITAAVLVNDPGQAHLVRLTSWKVNGPGGFQCVGLGHRVSVAPVNKLDLGLASNTSGEDLSTSDR
jgi:hypothetical protein